MEMAGTLFQYILSAMIIVLMSIGIYLISSAFHEGSHWIIGRIWSDDLQILRLYLIFPVSVIFHSPYDLPSPGVRLAGVAPMLFCLPVAVAIYITLDASSIGRVLFSLPFWAASILSPSDLLAILYPKRFQEHASNGDAVGQIGMIKILLGEFHS